MATRNGHISNYKAQDCSQQWSYLGRQTFSRLRVRFAKWVFCIHGTLRSENVNYATERSGLMWRGVLQMFKVVICLVFKCQDPRKMEPWQVRKRLEYPGISTLQEYSRKWRACVRIPINMDRPASGCPYITPGVRVKRALCTLNRALLRRLMYH